MFFASYQYCVLTIDCNTVAILKTSDQKFLTLISETFQVDPSELMTVESDNDILSDDNCSPDFGPPTNNPFEDIVYNDSTEMSSFLPFANNKKKLKLLESSFLKTSH